MSLEDPFFVVKEEVEKAVTTSEGLYQRWCELLNDSNSVSKEKYDWTTNELKNSLKSIEWDLEDLEETIDILIIQVLYLSSKRNEKSGNLNVPYKWRLQQETTPEELARCIKLTVYLTYISHSNKGIVEANPRKFKISADELESRRRFVAKTKTRLEQMKEHMSSPNTKTKEDSKSRKALFSNGPKISKNKYSRLNNELENENQRFIEDQNQQQQLIMEAQDDQMDRVADSVTVLKYMGETIGNEVDEQAVMLDGFSTELENTESKLDSVMKKMAKVTKMSNDKRQWTAIIVLVVILVIVLLLFFIT